VPARVSALSAIANSAPARLCGVGLSGPVGRYC
jgi:hypothetical protein